MEVSNQGKLQMYLAVKTACEGKAHVWRNSPDFAEAFADFCVCIETLNRLGKTVDIFHSAAKGIDLEESVADTILTTEMDELIERFESVDVAFVDDYTAARSIEITENPVKSQ
jgi:hypothetical protein